MKNDKDETFEQQVAASCAKFTADMAALADRLPPEVRDAPMTDEEMTAFARAFKKALARTDEAGGAS